MESIQIDWLAIVIAAVLNLIIGFFWYSKWLFGTTWAKFQKEPIEKKHTGMSYVYTFLTSLIIAYFLAFFQAYLGVTSVTDGMFVGFCFWLGFVATTQISSVIWAETTFKTFLLDSSYKLLSFLVMSGVIGA